MQLPEAIELIIVTPQRQLLREKVASVQLPGASGELGILPGHAPLISELAVGEITFRSDSGEQRLAVASGFAEVLPDKVTVLAETAERPEEINVERARKAKEHAEQWLAGAQTEGDVERALEALRRAEVRLRVAGKS